jgi:hypothetical protein
MTRINLHSALLEALELVEFWRDVARGSNASASACNKARETEAALRAMLGMPRPEPEHSTIYQKRIGDAEFITGRVIPGCQGVLLVDDLSEVKAEPDLMRWWTDPAPPVPPEAIVVQTPPVRVTAVKPSDVVSLELGSPGIQPTFVNSWATPKKNVEFVRQYLGREVPIRKINIDGMEHFTAGDCEFTACDAMDDRRCPKCRRGRLHTQPLYNGIAYVCEECDKGWSD